MDTLNRPFMDTLNRPFMDTLNRPFMDTLNRPFMDTLNFNEKSVDSSIIHDNLIDLVDT
jgi:hypothetical protein